ncbi:uncharacterized protein J3R85_019404 [Psidium guajava]|nr:uncharacterized protein J3R85_019404 [Psidium guajava]
MSQGKKRSDQVIECHSNITNDITVAIFLCGCLQVPNFVMKTPKFMGSYVAAFLLQWRLALVGLPFVVLLVIPGLIHGRNLMGLARRVGEEYDKAGTIAEQGVSFIRTVYAFVGESKTMSDFSGAIEGSAEFGLKQRLAKGLALGAMGLWLGFGPSWLTMVAGWSCTMAPRAVRCMPSELA